MAESNSSRLQKRKLNVFLICLVCSFLAWSVSKLSETHTDTASFSLDFIETPDSLILDKVSKKQLDIRLRTSGFQFLRLNFEKRILSISLREVRKGPSGYYLPRQMVLSQIQRQLPGDIELLDFDGDALFINFLRLGRKKVPVVPDIRIELSPNYLLDGALELRPDSIVINGPDSEIDTINKVYTKPITLKNLMEDFELEAAILISGNLESLSLSEKKVRVSGKVFRFSEKIIEVPVEVLNVPEGSEIKTFPSAVPVLCKAPIEALKEIKASDFRVVADLVQQTKGQSVLFIKLVQKPAGVHSAQLLEESVEFILKKS